MTVEIDRYEMNLLVRFLNITDCVTLPITRQENNILVNIIGQSTKRQHVGPPRCDGVQLTRVLAVARVYC